MCRADLVDPTNRTCSVCLESIKLYDENIIRLPCSHLFHADCVTDWLGRSCTCPVCRYELPTDDPQYEVGRRDRMAQRKPRFTRGQLEQMSVKQLKDLLSQDYQAADKGDLIDFIIETGAIDLCQVDPPAQYQRMQLQNMSVLTLKGHMHDCGVFFDSREVVEKSDMITIWEQSGRLHILPEDDDQDRKPAAFEMDNTVSVETTPHHQQVTNHHVQPIVETVRSPETDVSDMNTIDERTDPTQLMEENQEFQPDETMLCTNDEESTAESLDSNEKVKDESAAPAADVSDFVVLNTQNRESERLPQPTPFQNYSSAELKRQAKAMGIDISSFRERQDILKLLAAAENAQLQEWGEWRESEIRVIASLGNIDLQGCHDRTSLVHAMQAAARRDLQLCRYVRSMAPLARMSTPQLRALAREWQVGVADCIEKGDILRRLAEAGGPTGQFEA